MLEHSSACARPAARKVKSTARRGKSLVDEVREVLADVVIAHVPVVKFDFRQKVTYLAVMLRRLMGAVMDPSQTDDRCVAPSLHPMRFEKILANAHQPLMRRPIVCNLSARLTCGWRAGKGLLRQQAFGAGGRTAGAAVRGPVQTHEQRPTQAGM